MLAAIPYSHVAEQRQSVGSRRRSESGSTIASAELGTLIPSNIFIGTLTLPSGWLNSTAINAEFVGTLSAAAINAGALSNDNTTWGAWVAATSDVATTTTWTVSGEGANKPIYLRLRDINDQVATVVTGTVNVDLTRPDLIDDRLTLISGKHDGSIVLVWLRCAERCLNL